MLLGKFSSKGGKLSIDIFKPWNMSDPRDTHGRSVDYWTFIPKDLNKDGKSKQVVFWWDNVFQVNKNILSNTWGAYWVKFQRPIKEIEAEVSLLKPKALIVAAGLHFVVLKPNWDKYKVDLRRRLHELVNISKKVIHRIRAIWLGFLTGLSCSWIQR